MQQQKSPVPKRKSAINEAARYTGLAFQLFGACLFGALLGRQVDAYCQFERPFGTVFLSLSFLVASLYALYRQLLKG
jgi:F0F1-type ATP synthase assembly protein I